MNLMKLPMILLSSQKSNQLWNCSWFTSGQISWDEKKEQYYIKKQGKTASIWQERKNNLAALWLDFGANSFYVTVKYHFIFFIVYSNIDTMQSKFERVPFGDKIAAIGGTLGLFLGFSFLGVLDILFWAKEKFSYYLKLGKKRTRKTK